MGGAAELVPGLFWWQARHPDWPGEDAGWGPDVSSYAVEAGQLAILLDPLAPPREVADRTSDLFVVLTCAWHSRDAAAMADRGAVVYAPERIAEIAGQQTYGPGDKLPGGIEALPAFYPGECALWLPDRRALVVGECLYGVDGVVRIPPPDWLPDGVSAADFKVRMAPLADLEAAWVLPAHGEPIRDAAPVLRSALSD